MTDSPESLQELTERLHAAAARLREGELGADQAAELVEECARLAGVASTELDRRVRSAADGPPPAPSSPGSPGPPDAAA